MILPPRASISAAASSRVRCSSDPVSTNVSPASVCSSVDAAAGAGPAKFDAGGPQPVDQVAVAIDREEPLDALRDGRTDAVDGDELLLGRVGDAIEVADAARERLRGGGADVVDAEADEQRHSGCVFEPSTRVDEELRAACTDPFERHELLDRQRVDVAGVVEQPRVGELPDPLLAEPLDVHRARARRSARCAGLAASGSRR